MTQVLKSCFEKRHLFILTGIFPFNVRHFLTELDQEENSDVKDGLINMQHGNFGAFRLLNSCFAYIISCIYGMKVNDASFP